jgi:UDP-glucose 6-dehydrogenase
LAFKPNTDDVRSSPSVRIANELFREKVTIQVYDPVALDNFRKLFAPDNVYLKYYNNAKDALKDADAVFIITEWDEFRTITPDDFKSLMKKPVIIDGRRIYNPETFEAAGIVYKAIGYSKSRDFIP